MMIIHDVDERSLPRIVGRSLDEHLRTMPAVVLTGARQTGKRTLVRARHPGSGTS